MIVAPWESAPTRYRVIYIDPPWKYSTYDAKPHPKITGLAEHHYRTMPVAEIAKLPIGDYADRDAALLMWVTAPLLEEAMGLFRAWGFRYVTKAFTWIKVTRDGRPVMGLGHHTRGNSEDVLLGLRGRMKRADAAVSQVITAPRRQHSRKPDETYGLIERLYGDVPRVEVFARQCWPTWDQIGDQAGMFPAEVPLLDGGPRRAVEPIRLAVPRRDGARRKLSASYSLWGDPDMWTTPVESAVAS